MSGMHARLATPAPTKVKHDVHRRPRTAQSIMKMTAMKAGTSTAPEMNVLM